MSSACPARGRTWFEAIRGVWPLDAVGDTQLGAAPLDEPVVLINNLENGKQISVDGTAQQQAVTAATLARFYRPEDRVMIYLSDASECRPTDHTLTAEDM